MEQRLYLNNLQHLLTLNIDFTANLAPLEGKAEDSIILGKRVETI